MAPGLHPSVSLLSSAWPAYAIWNSNRGEAEPIQIKLRPEASFAMVWRHRGTVQHRALTAADHAFLVALAHRQSLQGAAETALEIDPTHNAAAVFGEALANSILGGSRT